MTRVEGRLKVASEEKTRDGEAVSSGVELERAREFGLLEVLVVRRRKREKTEGGGQRFLVDERR